jgi:Ketopantoate reductase PanE/ApbA C terminal
MADALATLGVRRGESIKPPCCRISRRVAMELEALVGAVVELADHLAVPVPHTRTVYSCAKLLAQQNTAK